MSKLAKKVALVTGGSRGIGAAIAKRLAADGASVAITYAKDASAASAVVKAIELAGGKAIAIQADAANVEAVKGAVEKAVSTFGRLDVLVNNAGTAMPKPFEEATQEEMDRVLDINVRGVSERTGEILAARAGKNLKRSTMELGGSDAFVVLEDADLDHTIAMAVLGRFGNCGQTCIGAKRFIVVEPVLDRFLSGFIAAISELKLGDPLDETVTLGPLSSDAALQLILRQIKEATDNGARVVLGGRRAGDTGAFLEPTILTNDSAQNAHIKRHKVIVAYATSGNRVEKFGGASQVLQVQFDEWPLD
jgi:Aldehyde dehydrogenase family/short chain dehydrogenase